MIPYQVPKLNELPNDLNELLPTEQNEINN